MLQLPEVVKKVWRTPMFRMDENEHSVYLTFDDGPHPRITKEVMQILQDFDVKATFFCVGENVVRYSDTYQEINDSGHAVGNHTYNHINGFTTTTKSYLENVEKADGYIQSDWFRPPYGRITPRQVSLLSKKYKIVMWDFITYDYAANIAPEKILEEVKRRTRNGSIVVFHDSLKAEKNVLTALPKVLEFWKSEAYMLKLFSASA